MYVHQLSYQHHPSAPYFFKDLSFELNPGKIHALHGKNGIGKSVLLNLLNQNQHMKGIIKGEIKGAEKTALVNQRFDYMIADQFSFEENLKFACMSSFPNPFLKLKKVCFYHDLIEKFHIDISQPVYKLSGGQRQILSILMVLQQKKTFLLLDEPTATLDEQNAVFVFEFLKSLTLQDISLLVVCHDRGLMNHYANGSHLYLELNSAGLRKLEIIST